MTDARPAEPSKTEPLKAAPAASDPEPPGAPVPPEAPVPFGRLVAFLAVAALGAFLVRLTGPPTIFDNDQQRPAAYVLDLMTNGEWLVQRDDTGDITSKPPFFTWAVSLTALALGGLDRFTLYLPGALCVLGLSLILLAIGRRPFGTSAAFLGAAALILSRPGFRLVNLARTDALFALTVFASAWLFWRALLGRSSWFWFWLTAALATLTKGPLGLVLALGGAWGAWGARRTEAPADEASPCDAGGGDAPASPGEIDPCRRGALGSFLAPGRGHAVGIAVFLLLCAGWFALAWMSAGQPLIDKMIGKELVGHAVRAGSGQRPFEGFYKPILYFLHRFLPWAPFALVGIWRVATRPSDRREVRLFERFLAGYFLLGMLVFSAAPHQRWDHQVPLLPAAALLAGREIVRLLPAAWIRKGLRLFPAVLALVLAIDATAIHVHRPELVRLSECAREAASRVRADGGNGFPLMHVDGTMGLQFFLQTMKDRVTPERAREALLSEGAAYVAVRDPDVLRELLPEGHRDGRTFRVARWTLPGRKAPAPEIAALEIVGNRPTLRVERHQVFYQGALRVETRGLRLQRATRTRFRLETLDRLGPVDAAIRNTGETPVTVDLRIERPDGPPIQERRTLEPGAETTIAG